MGTVRLTVSDLARSRAFYERALGLRGSERDDGTLALGPSQSEPLVELRPEAAAPPLDPRRTGLYHLAILVPSRVDLAQALARLIQTRWPLDGASDHLVSEALYLSDPDGNGIEIYRDRPRQEWRYSGDRLEMATLPLDLHNLMGELKGAETLQEHAPTGTRMGHVHLQVADLDAAEAFYSGVLGFDVMVRGYPGALFVSAGGYHHHLGLNTWHSLGAPSPEPGAIGLRSFEVNLPNRDELARVLDRVSAAGLQSEAVAGERWLVRDPSGNAVLLGHPPS
jgi:catechol 2,3-dioxygenase